MEIHLPWYQQPRHQTANSRFEKCRRTTIQSGKNCIEFIHTTRIQLTSWVSNNSSISNCFCFLTCSIFNFRSSPAGTSEMIIRSRRRRVRSGNTFSINRIFESFGITFFAFIITPRSTSWYALTGSRPNRPVSLIWCSTGYTSDSRWNRRIPSERIATRRLRNDWTGNILIQFHCRIWAHSENWRNTLRQIRRRCRFLSKLWLLRWFRQVFRIFARRIIYRESADRCELVERDYRCPSWFFVHILLRRLVVVTHSPILRFTFSWEDFSENWAPASLKLYITLVKDASISEKTHNARSSNTRSSFGRRRKSWHWACPFICWIIVWCDIVVKIFLSRPEHFFVFFSNWSINTNLKKKW